MNNIRALIVGVPKYERKDISDLEYCANDVLEMTRVLFDSLGVNPRKINSIGKKADELTERKTILRKLNETVSQVTEDETLLFYFSGHGFSLDSENFLITSDTELDLIEETSISLDYVFKKVKKSKSKVKLIIIDSCHSGIHTSKNINSGYGQLNLKDIQAEGIVLFASSKGDEFSFIENENKMSIFTHYLIRGLQGKAELDKDSRLSLENLNRYVTSKVYEWSAKNNSSQTPNLKMELAGTFYFNVSTNIFLGKPKNDKEKEVLKKIEGFKEYLSNRGYKSTTVKHYSSFLRRFLISYLPFHWTEILNKESIEGEIDEYIEFGYFGSTAANSLINSIKIFAQMEGIELEDINRPGRQKSRNLNEPLTEEQVSTFIENIKNLKHRLIVSIIYYGTIGISELINIKLSDVNFIEGTIIIREEIGDGRLIKLEEKVKTELNNYHDEFYPKEYLFNGLNRIKYSSRSIQNIIKNNREVIKSKNSVTARLLKKSRMANLITSGKSVKEIYNLTGVILSK